MTSECTISRDKELRKRFNDMLTSGININYYNWSLVAEMLANQPAPRFYISPKVASQYVFAYYHGTYKLKSEIGRRMIVDLVETYERIKSLGECRYNYEVWNKVVESPAKSFYLKPNTIERIIYEYIRPTQRFKSGVS